MGEMHGTHSLSPFQIHAGAQSGDQRWGEEKRARMHQKAEMRKRGGRTSSPKHPKRPSIAHTAHSSQTAYHRAGPDALHKARGACCPLSAFTPGMLLY